jgi:hypothetical protein
MFMIAIRLGTHHKEEEQAKALIALLRRYPGACDEVWLCSEYGFPPMEVHYRAAAKWERVAELFRNEGFRVSLQISNTIGHGAYMRNLDNRGLLENITARRMVGANGKEAKFCFCWFDEAFRAYCADMVKAYAKTKPFCVWVDDDLRADNHFPVDYGCFCEDCIDRFNKEQGQNFTRETLVSALDGDVSVRKAFVEFTKAGLSSFTKLLTHAVHEVSPDSFLGYQYAQIYGYDGDDRKYIFDAMFIEGKAPKSRPGGGFYTDHRPTDLIEKQFLVGYSNFRLPSYVTEIRPEVENTPDVPYGKTVYGTCLEAALYFAGGANRISFATLMTEYEPLYYHARFLESFAQARPYWEKMASENEKTRPAGVSPALPKEGYLRPVSSDSGFLSWAQHTWHRAALGGFYNGFPMCYDDNAPLVLLSAENIAGMTKAERKALAFRPVITDVEGFAAFCKAEGLSCVEFVRAKGPCREVFLTGADKGAGWNVPLGHEGPGPLAISRLPEGAEILSRFDGLPFDGEVGVASALVPMDGARWAVIGTGLWDRVVSSAKRRQIWAAAEAVCKEAFPAKIEQPAQVGLFARQNEKGQTTSVSVLHYGLGPSETPLTLRVFRPKGSVAKAWSHTRQNIRLLSSAEGDSLLITLPKMNGWDMLTVFLEG